MSTLNPFTPNTAGSVTSATITGSSQNINLAKSGISQQVLVQLGGTTPAVAFIEFGISTTTAAIATGTPILPTTPYLFTIGPGVTSVAIIGSAGTMYFTTGQGSAGT
jgi:hypothetical protein